MAWRVIAGRKEVRTNQPQAVAYIGSDDHEVGIYHGHPGRIIDAPPARNEVTVSFVNGPSLSLPLAGVESISEHEYAKRGHRLVRLRHPLEDREVPGFNAEGSEWPDQDAPADDDI